MLALPYGKLRFIHSLGLGVCLRAHTPFLTEKGALGVKSSVYPTKRPHACGRGRSPQPDLPFQPLLYPALSIPSLHDFLPFLPQMTRQCLSWAFDMIQCRVTVTFLHSHLQGQAQWLRAHLHKEHVSKGWVT